MESSFERHEIIKKFPSPWKLKTVQDILSDEVPNVEEKVKNSIFKRALLDDDHYATVAVGIFDLTEKTWSIYTHPPNKSKPVAIIPLTFES